jgi:hypothetical protein
MSFDLFFCWDKTEPINFDSVVEWADQHTHFQRKAEQLWYENEDTGVYFSLDFDIKEAKDSPIPPEFGDSGLSFNLNYNRPSYFAYEAMPIVTDLSQTFGLSIFDSQGQGEPEVQQNPKTEELIHSWFVSNQNAIGTLHEMGDPQAAMKMPLATSTYLWHYSLGKRKLQAKLGDGIFVPSLVPLRKRGAGQIGTVIVCTVGIPMVIPQSDWVMISRIKKQFLGLGEEKRVTSIVGRRVFDDAITGYGLPLDDWEPAAKIINQESVSAVADRLKALKNQLPSLDFETVARDSFVDVEDEQPKIS